MATLGPGPRRPEHPAATLGLAEATLELEEHLLGLLEAATLALLLAATQRGPRLERPVAATLGLEGLLEGAATLEELPAAATLAAATSSRRLWTRRWRSGSRPWTRTTQAR